MGGFIIWLNFNLVCFNVQEIEGRKTSHTKTRGNLAMARFMLAAGEIAKWPVIGVRTNSLPARVILTVGAMRYKGNSQAARFIFTLFLRNFSHFYLYPLKIFTSNLPKTFIPPSLSSLYLKTSIFYSDLFNLERFGASISIFCADLSCLEIFNK